MLVVSKAISDCLSGGSCLAFNECGMIGNRFVKSPQYFGNRDLREKYFTGNDFNNRFALPTRVSFTKSIETFTNMGITLQSQFGVSGH